MDSTAAKFGWIGTFAAYCLCMWRFYAETFGKLHERLVDVLFKYNSRDRKGRYMATLAGTNSKFRGHHT